MTTRKIAFVTNARSDYSTLYPVMEAAQRDPGITTQLFCGGMHLRPEFGETWRQLEQDNFKITAKIDYFAGDDSPMGLAKAMGKGVTEFAKAIEKHKPDIIVAHGDRIENLALYTAATSLRKPIAHMCGGDITEGAFDNQVRHAMTKLSHLHFVSMEEHARRVVQMGEEPWRVILTGDAAIDTIVSMKPMSRAELEKATGIPAVGELVTSTFHPQTLGDNNSAEQYKNILAVLADAKAIPVLSYPNIDPGYEPLVELLEAFAKKRRDAVVRKSFTREQYYSLLSHAQFMIGNSSSGLWEAPSFALPAVNVGERQAGRLRGKNVIDVTGLDLAEMRAAVKKATDPAFKASLKGINNPYGNGQAAALTLQVLKTTPIDNRLMMKKFHEMPFDVMALGIKEEVA